MNLPVARAGTLAGSLASSARLAATSSPDAIALVDGPIRWNWRELDERADAVARGLVAAGIGPGDRVALLAAPSAFAIAVLHGLARVGAVAAPLGTRLTPTELAAAGEIIDPVVVVHGSGFEAGASILARGRPLLTLADLTVARVTPEPGPLAIPAVDLAAPAVVVMTSGTTGRPRAAVLSTGALIASADAWLAALPPATGWLLSLGLGHVAGLGVVWRAALAGVPLLVLPRSDPAEIGAALTGMDGNPGPSHVSLVPTILARLLDVVADTPPPPTLRAVLLGGGTISPELVVRAVRAGWPVVPTYGLTEAGSGVTALPTEEAAEHPDSAGRALPGVEVRIAEPDEAGVGVIQVLTPARFTGYLGDPMGTAAMLSDEGWLATGDLGRLDQAGLLIVFDRRTDLIVRGGENVSPSEVEAVLLQHPAIADAAVVARRDSAWGHVPVAAVVVGAGAIDPGDEVLAQHCRNQLAAFKVPVAFVRLETLPRTSGGKLRRVELRERLDPTTAAGTSARTRHVDRPDGVRLAYRLLGGGPLALVLLHGTLSTAGQLLGLARLLVGTGEFTVLALDRRGSGGSRLAEPSPLGIDVHVADVTAVLDAEGYRAAVLVGVSFGGVVALETAARMPARTLAVVAYEPPYGPVADADTQRAFVTLAAATERAYRTSGAPAAAEAFMRGVAGVSTWDRLPERTRAFLASEGDGAYVDAGLQGLNPSGLDRIGAPVTLLTGDASEPFYRPITEALLRRIPGSRHVALAGLAHTSPITDPVPVASAVVAALGTIKEPS